MMRGDVSSRKPVRTICQCLLALLGSLACSTSVAGHSHEGSAALIPDQDAAQMNHAVFTIRDGAPAEIVDVIEGHDGFLWIGTSVGLTRFDGVRFEHDPIPNFPRQGVYTVKTEENGDLWVGFSTGGLAHIHDGHVTVFDQNDAPAGTVFDIFRLADGVLWAVTSREIARFLGGRWERVGDSTGYKPERPTGTTHAPGGSVLIEDKGRAYAISAGESAFHEVPHDEFIRQSFDIEVGNAWRPSDPESIGIRDKAGTHWIVEKGGIDRYHWRTGGPPRIEHIGKKEGLSSDTVVGIYQGRRADVWLWSDFGLERFRPNRMTRLLVPDDPTNPVMERDATEGIWFSAGAKESLYRANGSELTKIEKKTSVGAMFVAHDGTLWTVGEDGIDYSKEGKHGHIPLPTEAAGVGAISMQSIGVDRNGIVWLMIVRRGLFSYASGQWTRKLAAEEHGPMRMVQDTKERLWAIYARNRVTVADDNTTQTFDSSNNVDVGYLLSIDAGSSRIWIGGRTGIQFLREGRFETLATDTQDSLTGVSGLVVTPSGELWANTDRGLALIDQDDIDASLVDPSHVNRVHWLDFNDGIEGTPSQSRPLPTLVTSQDGRVWASTNQGIFWIDPDAFKIDTRQLTGVATALFADGKSVDLGGLPHLPQFTHAVQIDYTAPELSMSKRIRFRYRLQGFDTEWQDAGDRRSAFYTALAPGDYAFHLSVANADGLWGEDKQVGTFRLTPGWYQTNLFKVACVFFGVLICGSAVSLRNRRASLRRRVRMAERERIARELHDTLLQGTQGLIYHVGSALKKTSEPALRISLIDAMERAQDALVEVRERVSALRDDDRTPVDFVALLRSAARTITHGHDIYLDLETDGAERLLGASAAAELATVCQEALSNVVAHASARTLLVRVSFRRRWLRIIISDDGEGIEEAVLRAGGREGHWGLLGMRERVELFQGRIEIEPRAGGGTIVTIQVKGPTVYAK